jgi:hypothetical protein
MAGCEHNNLCPLAGEEGIGTDQQSRDGSLRERRECRVNLMHGIRTSQYQLAPNGLGRSFDALDLYVRIRPAWVQQHREWPAGWRQFMQ